MKGIKYNVTSEREKNGLTKFLKDSGIHFEMTGEYLDWNFEIDCNGEEAAKIGDYIIALEKSFQAEPREYHTLETERKDLKEKFSVFLKKSKIYYELSSCFDGWHFEVKCSRPEVELIDIWLDRYYDELEKSA